MQKEEQVRGFDKNVEWKHHQWKPEEEEVLGEGSALV